MKLTAILIGLIAFSQSAWARTYIQCSAQQTGMSDDRLVYLPISGTSGQVTLDEIADDVSVGQIKMQAPKETPAQRVIVKTDGETYLVNFNIKYLEDQSAWEDADGRLEVAVSVVDESTGDTVGYGAFSSDQVPNPSVKDWLTYGNDPRVSGVVHNVRVDKLLREKKDIVLSNGSESTTVEKLLIAGGRRTTVEALVQAEEVSAAMAESWYINCRVD